MNEVIKMKSSLYSMRNIEKNVCRREIELDDGSVVYIRYIPRKALAFVLNEHEREYGENSFQYKYRNEENEHGVAEMSTYALADGNELYEMSICYYSDKNHMYPSEYYELAFLSRNDANAFYKLWKHELDSDEMLSRVWGCGDIDYYRSSLKVARKKARKDIERKEFSKQVGTMVLTVKA